MWPSSSLLLSSLALRFAAVNAQALATVTYGPSGPCPVPSVTSVVVVQAGYYSSFFQSASQIVNLFGNGETVTIENAPTTYITNTYITTTIISTVTSVVSPSTTSSTSTSPITSTTPSGSASVGPVTTSAAPASSLSTSISTTSTPTSTSTSPGPSTTSTTEFTPIPPPATTPTPPPVLTSTSVDAEGNTILVPITQPPLTLGEGLPSGTVTDLPASSAVIIGIAVGGLGGSKVKRQDSGTQAQASQLLSGDDGGSSNACDVAVRYFLQGGQLTDGTAVVGRNTTDYAAVITPDPDFNNVTTVFAFVNGILQWDSPDQGLGSFYHCGDNKVWAGFPSPPRPDCYDVTLGGIAASACPVPYRDPDVSTSSTTISSSTSTSTDVASTTTTEVTTTTTTDTESPTSPTTTPEPSSSSDQSSTESSAISSPFSSSAPVVTSSLGQTTESTVVSASSNAPPATTTPASTGSPSSAPFGTSSSIVPLQSSSTSIAPVQSSSTSIPPAQSSSTSAVSVHSSSATVPPVPSSSTSPAPAQSSSTSMLPSQPSSSGTVVTSSSSTSVPVQSSTTAGAAPTTVVTSVSSGISSSGSTGGGTSGSSSTSARISECEQSWLDDPSRYSVFLSFLIHCPPHFKHYILVPKQQLYNSNHVVLGASSWDLIDKCRNDTWQYFLPSHYALCIKHKFSGGKFPVDKSGLDEPYDDGQLFANDVLKPRFHDR
ncbi:hypothetical protein AYL99_07564 [Fonsecaea erecta]|uniref:DUF7908 domain-containing protein n=1 Tax=Fonsecaea erecta TaxID=1367422 RepID=A0A178ZFB2_9EURO|nr:hypothetical protein AYL99_07564 [Fonsecaea erecta]OAP58474.1 hypothetical protein AYL99_07564 [Fonsecaea erecta]